MSLVTGSLKLITKRDNLQTMNSIGKRKLPTEVKSKEVKIQRIDMKEKVKKVLTKAELVLELKSVKEAYEALKETNQENLKTIASLKGELKTSGKETISTHAQTDFNCNECIFQGSSNLELDWHVKNHHGWASVQESNDLYETDAEQNTCLQCNFCDEGFDFKSQLMEHRKKNHTESVQLCWNFSSGKCGYGDDKCWFLHCKASKSEMKCNFCDKTFASQSEFLTHRKRYHKQIVPPCRNLQNGKCGYTNENCWFNHNENENNDIIEIEENKEVIQKIFQMMENFTKEITKLKEMNNLQ